MTERDLFDFNSALGSYCGYMVGLGDTKQIIKIIWVVATTQRGGDERASTDGVHFVKWKGENSCQ